MARDLSQFLSEVRFPVDDDDGPRLDTFLADRVFWRSRTDLQSRIKRKKVLVNGETAKPSTRLRRGDDVCVMIEPSDLPDQDPASIAVSVLHEEPGFIVVDKQAGLVVHPTGRHVYDTLMNALFLRYRENGEAAQGIEPHVVHRLDRDTSGVIVVAKSFPVKRDLSEQFVARTTTKEYTALVKGRIDSETLRIDSDLGRDEKAEIKLKMTTVANGLSSLTEVDVIERFENHTLVRAKPKTGRQHQIRVHLASVGHPILCDPLYGDPRSLGYENEEPLLERQALHAGRLSFRHPESEETVSFEAGLAADMNAIADLLRSQTEPWPSRDVQSSRWGNR